GYIIRLICDCNRANNSKSCCIRSNTRSTSTADIHPVAMAVHSSSEAVHRESRTYCTWNISECRATIGAQLPLVGESCSACGHAKRVVASGTQCNILRMLTD